MPIRIPLDLVVPNPWQPRTHFDDEALAELAADIQRNGLLQPPIGRVVGADGRLLDPAASTLYDVANASGTLYDVDGRHAAGRLAAVREAGHRIQLAAGERRFRAFQRLAAEGAVSLVPADLFAPPTFEAIPVDLRPFPDTRMATLAWAENASRKDITAVEEARFIARLVAPVEEGGFGWTQELAGKEVGLVRSAVSNKLRLLKLPPEIIELLAAGEITEKQARALIPAFTLNERQEEAFAAASKESYAWPSPATLRDLVKEAKRGVPGDDLARSVKQFIGALESRIEREAAKVREAEEREKKLAAAAEGTAVLRITDLHWNAYARVSDDPKSGLYCEGCTLACACRAKAEGYGGETVEICTDKPRHDAMLNAVRREEKKLRKAKADKKLAAVLAALAGEGGALTAPVLRALAAAALRHGESKNVVAAAVALGLPERYELPDKYGDALTGYDAGPRRKLLELLSGEDAVRLALLMRAVSELRDATESGSGDRLEFRSDAGFVTAILAKEKPADPLALAEAAGRAAYRDGYGIHDNPHTAPSERAPKKAWSKGWDAELAAHKAEHPEAAAALAVAGDGADVAAEVSAEAPVATTKPKRGGKKANAETPAGEAAP